eukprot:gene5603-6789_t
MAGVAIGVDRVRMLMGMKERAMGAEEWVGKVNVVGMKEKVGAVKEWGLGAKEWAVELKGMSVG